jgi:hypothetical protein
MNYLLDIIFSFIIGGIVIVLLQGLMFNMSRTAGSQTLETIAQTNVTTAADIVMNDIRKIGYGSPGPQDSAIIYADANKIVLKGDLDDNGSYPDSVSYYLGATKPSGNLNPRTRYLYRKWQSGPEQVMNLGVTQFQFAYFDRSGNLLASVPNVVRPSQIRSIKVGIATESIMPWDKTYASASWEQVITPLNLR